VFVCFFGTKAIVKQGSCFSGLFASVVFKRQDVVPQGVFEIGIDCLRRLVTGLLKVTAIAL
jgi:hypothetical protein